MKKKNPIKNLQRKKRKKKPQAIRPAYWTHDRLLEGDSGPLVQPAHVLPLPDGEVLISISGGQQIYRGTPVRLVPHGEALDDDEDHDDED